MDLLESTAFLIGKIDFPKEQQKMSAIYYFKMGDKLFYNLPKLLSKRFQLEKESESMR